MSNRGILGSAAIARMPVTQNLQVLYGSQNYILKGNLSRIPNSPSNFFLNNVYVFDLVTFSTTLNSHIVYLKKKNFTHFFLNANIVLYNIVQNLRGLFSVLLQY